VANINYTVQGTDANGCTNTSVITIKVNSCIGINELNTAQITMYPNPSKGTITIKGNTNMECLLFNVNGQLIKQFTLDEIQGSYTIKDLSSGMYILKAESVQYKLIIE